MDSASDNKEYPRRRVTSYTLRGGICDCNSDICIFVLAFTIVFGPWIVLSFTSTEPTFKVSSMFVSLTNICNISDSNSLLTADWNITLYIENGFVDLLFERVEPRVLYSDVSLARTWLPPFRLYSYDGHNFLANLTAFSVPIHKNLAQGIASDWRNGFVKFTVVFRATVREKGIIWDKKKQMVSCEDVKVAFLPNDTQGIMVELGKARKCPTLRLGQGERVTHNPYTNHVAARGMKEGFVSRKY